MKRLAWGAGLALAVTGLVAGGAGSAFAFPSKATACNQCHSGPSIAVSTSLVSNNGTTATYRVTASADAAAVFNGGTKVADVSAAGGQFSVATGSTYTIYAVNGPGTSDGIGVASVTPARPVADTTAPTTTSDAKASYVGSASIRLTATDGTGGSGVAATYYRLDGGTQAAGTMVAVAGVGSHTLEFWSVDVAGNVEARKTVSFTVTSADITAPITTSDAVASYVGSATVKLTAADNAGGTGVAVTYYRLDGGAQTAGTSVTAGPGSHTLSFWSVDKAGNAEAPSTVSFTVAEAVPTFEPTALTIRTNRDALRIRRAAVLSGMLTPGLAGDAIGIYVMAPGSTEWQLVSTPIAKALTDGSGGASWTLRYRPASAGTYLVQARFAGDATREASVSSTITVVWR